MNSPINSSILDILNLKVNQHLSGLYSVYWLLLISTMFIVTVSDNLGYLDLLRNSAKKKKICAARFVHRDLKSANAAWMTAGSAQILAVSNSNSYGKWMKMAHL